METDSLTGRLVAAGELLKRARMGARYSQQRLAAEAGIGVRTVWRIEHGVQGDLPTYEAIAVVLGFPPRLVSPRCQPSGPRSARGVG